MARSFKNVSSTLLLVLVLIVDVSDATEILPEKCEDQYGADLNGRMIYSIIVGLFKIHHTS